MDENTKKSVIVIIPLVILLVTIGTITNYSLLPTILAGIIGALIGKILSSVLIKKDIKK
ncbi:hypothetical protein J4429_05305 [Candidatus Pacearchaeota archaeon]|nr:hypothetical protein [Candidatus Pacearchaeota archaeon]